MIDYFKQFPGLDPGPRYNNAGFWDLPIPVTRDITVHEDDIVIYDAAGYVRVDDAQSAIDSAVAAIAILAPRITAGAGQAACRSDRDVPHLRRREAHHPPRGRQTAQAVHNLWERGPKPGENANVSRLRKFSSSSY